LHFYRFSVNPLAMKIVIAPDTFKESLSASKAAAALAKGVLEVCPDAVIDLCPMADGGGGTVEAMVAATGGRLMAADVFSPLGSPLRAHFGLLGRSTQAGLPGELGLTGAMSASQGEGDVPEPEEGRTAVIEMAAASGLHLVPPERRDPMRTTTFGTGQLIMAALDAGASQIIIGLGGSATVDGGCGCAQAMGVVFMGKDNDMLVCGLSGGHLRQIERIDISDRDGRLAGVRVRVACDVKNPLTGPMGAAAVYGPQKGATPEMVVQLDAGLHHLAEIVRRDLNIEIETLSGAGAAGGLGAGLVAFAGGILERGVEIVAEAVNLKRRLADADLVITGEGLLDGSSSSGKTAWGVARLAQAAGVPVICIPGQASADAPRDLFAGVYPLVEGDVTPTIAMRKAQQLLSLRAAQAMQKFCD
jgi:glycerate kinase